MTDFEFHGVTTGVAAVCRVPEVVYQCADGVQTGLLQECLAATPIP